MDASPCPACDGSGRVAPDPWGHWEPWAAYVKAMETKALEKGWPPESSAIAAGLVRPIACPACAGGGDQS